MYISFLVEPVLEIDCMCLPRGCSDFEHALLPDEL